MSHTLLLASPTDPYSCLPVAVKQNKQSEKKNEITLAFRVCLYTEWAATAAAEQCVMHFHTYRINFDGNAWKREPTINIYILFKFPPQLYVDGTVFCVIYNWNDRGDSITTDGCVFVDIFSSFKMGLLLKQRTVRVQILCTSITWWKQQCLQRFTAAFSNIACSKISLIDLYKGTNAATIAFLCEIHFERAV